jgi:hypothetical protein
MTTPADVFDWAGGLVTLGWCQHVVVRQNDDGGRQYCAEGALDRACKLLRSPDGWMLLLALARIVGPVDDWNDAPERRQAEVVAAFRVAAALEREPSDLRPLRGWRIGEALRHNARQG